MPGRAPLVPDRLARAASARGFATEDGELSVLVAYLSAVVDQGQRLNLTAARTLDAAIDVLGLSALSVVRAWDRADLPPSVVVDLGTGNGLPGVAAALAWPAARVLLVERRRKKAEAVQACLAMAGIGNAEAVACDGRELKRERPEVVGAVDLVTVRAVGTLASVVPIAVPWLAPGGRIAHWKGARLTDAERKGGAIAARRAGLTVLGGLRFSDEAGPSHLVLYERPLGG